MQKILPFFTLFLTVLTSGYSQTFQGPESVEFDYARNRYLISNTGSDDIIARAADGTLTTLYNGSPASGSPHGLDIVGDTLYAGVGGSVWAINLVNDSFMYSQVVAGAAYLNGMTHDPTGNLYLTDFNNYQIYRFNTVTRQSNLYISNTVTKPNGIIYDSYDGINPRLVFGDWSSSAKVKTINMTDSTISNTYTTAINNIDGICKGKNGLFYLSSYTQNKVVSYDSTFTTLTNIVTTGLSSPADICFNFNTDTIAVPNAGGNTVKFYFVGLTTTLENTSNNAIFSVYPNPAVSELNIQLSNVNSNEVTITVYDMNGALVLSKQIKTNNKNQLINLPLSGYNLAQGNYTCQIYSGRDLIGKQKMVIGSK